MRERKKTRCKISNSESVTFGKQQADASANQNLRTPLLPGDRSRPDGGEIILLFQVKP